MFPFQNDQKYNFDYVLPNSSNRLENFIELKNICSKNYSILISRDYRFYQWEKQNKTWSSDLFLDVFGITVKMDNIYICL